MHADSCYVRYTGGGEGSLLGPERAILLILMQLGLVTDDTQRIVRIIFLCTFQALLLSVRDVRCCCCRCCCCSEWDWKPGNYLGSDIGIVFVVLGRRIWDDGKPGVSPARHKLCSKSPRARKEYQDALLPSLSKQQTNVSTNEYLFNTYQVEVKVSAHWLGYLLIKNHQSPTQSRP